MDLKDLFEKEIVNLSIRTDGCRDCLNSESLTSMFSRITGKISNYLDFPSIIRTYHKLQITPSKEESEKFSKLFKDIISEFGLESRTSFLVETVGKDYYNPIYSGYDKNSTLGYREILRYGKDIVGNITYIDFDGVLVPSFGGVVYTEDSEEIAKRIWSLYSEACYDIVKDHKEDVIESYKITTVVSGQHGSYETYVTDIFPTVSLTSPDFLYNYNEDFPEDKIKDFFEMDKGGIMIFNGYPGCGKSTYIKSLVFKHIDINFVILPQYLLLGQEAFRNLLFRMSSNCVFIIEDCEQLLVRRENNPVQQFSSIISDILNYTDGIIGDLTRTKFIFTFNTDLQNIDKALLRPGRLFLKYEFTPLKGENLEKIASKIGYTLSEKEKKDGISLAELYSKTKTEDLILGSEIKKKRIGFFSGEDIVSLGGN